MTPLDAAALLLLLARVTTILAVAWLITRASWSGSASVRHAVWCCALGMVILLPGATRWLPPLSVPVPGLLAFASGPTSPEAPLEPVGTSPSYASTRSAATPGGSQPVPRTTAEADTARVVQWWQALVVIWAAGTILRLTWLLLLHARIRLLTSRARSAALFDPLVTALSGRLGMARGFRVLTAHEVQMPLAWGIVRPVILLPHDALEWTEERLRIVLLHELSHVRRGDYVSSLLAEIVCALYWPSPLTWVARRRVRMEQEQACDDRVLALGVPPVAYADHLLAIARTFYGNRWYSGVVVTMAREVGLKQRIRAILDERTDRRPWASLRGISVALWALSLFLPISTLRSAEPKDPRGSALPGSALEAAPPAAAPSSAPISPAYLWIEAEHGVPSHSTFAQGDLEASQAEFLILAPSGENDAALSVDLDIAVPGEYFLWTRIDAAVAGAPAHLEVWASGALAQSDAGPGFVLPDKGDSGWTWVRFTDRGADPNSGNAARLTLDAGRHSLNFAAIEGPVRVDRLLLTSDAEFTPVAKGAPSSGRANYTLLEAEEGLRYGRIREGSDEHASNGSFVVFREARGSTPDAAAEFKFVIPEGGRYLIWGRTHAEDETSNSFHLSVDGGEELTWDLPARSTDDQQPHWTWDPVSTRSIGDRRIDPLAFDLGAGRHVVRIRARENGAHLDALLITNDLERRPDGVWPDALPERPVRVELAAGNARLHGPIALRPATDVEDSVHLAVESEGRAPKPGRAGLATFEFEASEAGLYSFWARTVAPSSDQDSFWVRIDGGEWILWNGIPQSDDWRWATIRDADADGRLLQNRLEPGRHTLEIAGREGGVMIERLLVTNDPRLQPS